MTYANAAQAYRKNAIGWSKLSDRGYMDKRDTYVF